MCVGGGTSDGPPGPRPEYSAGYYAAFVRDPEGNKTVDNWFNVAAFQAVTDSAGRVKMFSITPYAPIIEFVPAPASLNAGWILPVGGAALLIMAERNQSALFALPPVMVAATKRSVEADGAPQLGAGSRSPEIHCESSVAHREQPPARPG